MNTRTQYIDNFRRICVILFLLFTMFVNIPEAQRDTIHLLLNSKSLRSQSSSNSPTIEWYPRPANVTEPNIIFWDGIYTGQTQETWIWTVCVNDSDGIDTVFFRFQYTDSDEWFNKSTIRIEGDVIQGKYEVTLTWGVTWNSEWESPMWVNGSGTFWFKVWANDTLGNWNETEPVLYTGGYLIIHTPTTPSSSINPPYELYIIGGFTCFSIAVIVSYITIKRKKDDKQ